MTEVQQPAFIKLVMPSQVEHLGKIVTPALLKRSLVTANIYCHRAVESAVDAVSDLRSETATSRVPYYNLIMPLGA